jgi:phage terminase large subunit
MKMRIKRENNVMIMSTNLVCENHSDMKHYVSVFDKVSDNEYKCVYCGTVMVVKEPVLIHDEFGRLRMEVAVEPKGE